MQLLPQPENVQSIPLEKKLQKAGFQLKAMAEGQYKQICRMQKEGIKFMWGNPDGLTPQQVADLAGTSGGKLMAFHGGLTNFIIAAAATDGVAPDIAIPTNNFTVNKDGTVTVLDTPYGS